MFNKLRTQLTLWYSLGILTAIILLLVFFFFATNVVFYAQVDETLDQHVKAIASSVERGAKQSGCGCLSEQSTFLNGILQMPGMSTAIFNENGQIVKSSIDFLVPPKPSNPSSPFYFNAPLSGQAYRFLSRPVVSNNQQIGSVLMGHPIDAFLKTRSVLIIVIIVIIFIIFLPVILLGRFLAEKALRKEKQFLDDMAHSLKTPLAVLQSQIENQGRSALLSQVKKISQTVSKTLETAYSQTDHDQDGPVDLTSLLEELTEIAEHLGQKKQIKIIKDLPQNRVLAQGTKQSLAKAILAVLENAIDYGKINGKIKVSLKKDNPASAGSNRAILIIADNGLGLDQEDLPRVFDRFYRGKNSKSVGHGLGLSIAKNIIEELGGQIKIESQKNKGAQVFISLPIISA